MTHNSSRFDGKTALITGDSSGMGLATAHRLIAEGARVVITGRDKKRLDAAVTALGDQAHGIAGDATDLDDIDTLVAAVADRFGHLDLLFANAGIGSFQPIDQVTGALFDQVIGSNLKGPSSPSRRPCRCSPTTPRSSSTPPSAYTAASQGRPSTPRAKRPSTT